MRPWSPIVRSFQQSELLTRLVAYQLGFDTGGTYTDAVLINDEQSVVATAKSLTTHDDLIKGLRGAAHSVISDKHRPITLVSLSTTLATNALVEGRGRPVCLVLIGYRPEQLSKAKLVDALGRDPHGFINGGHNAAGEPVCELDTKALTELIESVQDNVEAFAVSALFSVRNPEHENQARELIHELTGKPVSCGHSLSSGLDAPRRALTALLNARLIPMIRALLTAAEQLLDELDISAPLMVVKGDGSLVSAAIAEGSPVETILSGPAASVVGAQFLSQEPRLMVSDMGGTTTDIAMIRNGQPRLSADGATVGGWRTMVEAIDVRTFGLGGDSRVVFNREQRDFDIGPERVMPISLLIHNHPELKQVLHDQLELPRSTTHSAEFVMAHAAEPTDLTKQQAELWEYIKRKPIDVQTVFNDQTLDRAMVRLTQRGIVLRAGFTPTDASHIVGDQNEWDTDAARLAARLLMRYSEANLGLAFDSEEQFAHHIKDSVSRLTALALLDTQLSEKIATQSRFRKGLDASQRALLSDLLVDGEQDELQMKLAMRFPVIALGAPVGSYYPKTAQWLNTNAIIPEQGNVANALGAVVGSVRQSVEMIITPAGGKSVSVHFDTGTKTFVELEEAASVAIATACDKARQLASDAGADNISVEHTRTDNVVDNDGDSVFFESRIVATAIGRPRTI